MHNSDSTRRIGIFGGTFDPPHLGHCIVAREVVEALDLETLLWLPAGIPPHKADTTITSAETRLRMVRAAVAGEPMMEVSDCEIHRQGLSYTIDTIRELLADDPNTEIFLVIGADQLTIFDRWKEWEEIVKSARLAVLDRLGSLREGHASIDIPYRVIPVTRVDISSTEIRGRVGVGRSVRHLVPGGVWEIIEEEGLYQN